MLYDFIILGAGASGLFFSANYQGGPTLLLERQERPGRKLLLSGGGKCNITNLKVGPENYLCADALFCRPALLAFRPEQLLDWLNNRRIAWEEREHGQIFCRRGAEEVRDRLLAETEKRGGRLLTGQRLETVTALEAGWEYRAGKDSRTEQGDAGQPFSSTPSAARFRVLSNGRAHFGRNLLVATGNKAWPRSGSSVFGLSLAQAAGHGLTSLRPGLTPLCMPPHWPLHGLQGITVTAGVSLGQTDTPRFTLPLLFTHHGLSGPACLQISSYLPEGGSLQIDFLPGQNLEQMLDERENGRASLRSLLRRRLPERLADALLLTGNLEAAANRKVAELSRAARREAAEAVHRHTIRPEAPGFGQAESTVGGVETNGIDPKTMQSRSTPGLFFTGEVLDVCGQLGGYNLNWAWASAAAAGRAGGEF